MGDRFYDELEFALSSCTIRNAEEYVDEDEESDGDYDGEEVNGFGNGAKSEDLACPFCAEDFDVLGLCCHIDADHRMDVKAGICPVCATKVGVNMASHVITQHEDILKALCLKNLHSTRSRSAVFLLRRDMQDKYLRIIKDSQPVDLSRGKAVDSMLVSFVNNPQPKVTAQEAPKVATATEAKETGSTPKEESSESRIEPPSSGMSHEQAMRCQFLQELLLSTFLDDL